MYRFLLATLAVAAVDEVHRHVREAVFDYVMTVGLPAAQTAYQTAAPAAAEAAARFLRSASAVAANSAHAVPAALLNVHHGPAP